jgi:hypothetical protein
MNPSTKKVLRVIDGLEYKYAITTLISAINQVAISSNDRGLLLTVARMLKESAIDFEIKAEL